MDLSSNVLAESRPALLGSLALMACCTFATDLFAIPPQNSSPSGTVTTGYVVSNPAVLEAAKESLGVTDCTLFSMNVNSARAHWREGWTRYRIPFPDGVYTVALAPYSIRTSDFNFISRCEGSPDSSLDIPSIETMRGYVEEIPNSVAVAVWLKNGLAIHVRGREESRYEYREVTQVANSQTYAAYTANQLAPPTSRCPVGPELGFTDSFDEAAGACPTPYDGICSQSSVPVSRVSVPMTARLIMDTDYEFHHKKQVDLLPICEDTANLTSLLLEDAISVRYELAVVVVRPNPACDHYAGIGVGGTLLSRVATEWGGEIVAGRGAAAHLLTGIGSGNPGLANLGSAFGPAGVSYSRDTGSRGFAAHEIGHTWGALHCATDSSECCMCVSNSVMNPSGASGWFDDCTNSEGMVQRLDYGLKQGLVLNDVVSGKLRLEVGATFPSFSSPADYASGSVITLPALPAGTSGSIPIRLKSYYGGDFWGGPGLAIETISQIVPQSQAMDLEMSPGNLYWLESLSGQLNLDGRYAGLHRLTVNFEACNVLPVVRRARFDFDLDVTPDGHPPGSFQAEFPLEGATYDYGDSAQIYFRWKDSIYAETYSFTLTRTQGRNGPDVEVIVSENRPSWRNFYLTQIKGLKPCSLAADWYRWKVVARNRVSQAHPQDPEVSVSRTFQVTNVANLPRCNQSEAQ